MPCIFELYCHTKTFTCTCNETITPEWQNLFQTMHISLRPDKLVLQAARQTFQAGRLRTNREDTLDQIIGRSNGKP